MKEKERDALRTILHTELGCAIQNIERKVAGLPSASAFATEITDALAEEIDTIVEACVDIADGN